MINDIKGQKGGKFSGAITWNDPIEIQQYNEKIQLKTTELIAENRKLSKVHHNVVDMINELMNVDLLNNRNTWKTNLQKIRKIIDTDINPHVNKWEAEESYPAREVFKKLADAGLLGDIRGCHKGKT